MVDLCLLQSCKEFKTEPNVRGIKHSCGFINRNEYETSTFLKKNNNKQPKVIIIVIILIPCCFFWLRNQPFSSSEIMHITI